MSFRKRSTPLTSSSSARPLSPTSGTPSTSTSRPAPASLPGTRPSPLTSHPVTSTGTPTLDTVLAHGGLPLGTSLLLEERETTDYAGLLLKYAAAEGVMQGHAVFVLGAGPGWERDLPGVTEEKVMGNKDEAGAGKTEAGERMKIAWRYERLGRGGDTGERRGALSPSETCEGDGVHRRISMLRSALESAQLIASFYSAFDTTVLCCCSSYDGKDYVAVSAIDRSVDDAILSCIRPHKEAALSAERHHVSPTASAFDHKVGPVVDISISIRWSSEEAASVLGVVVSRQDSSTHRHCSPVAFFLPHTCRFTLRPPPLRALDPCAPARLSNEAGRPHITATCSAPSQQRHDPHTRARL
ncbi:hypothetical protein MRB53_038940 [Persea americana]|nr:hypothetical protein MRB53_038940 [Persea americana]